MQNISQYDVVYKTPGTRGYEGLPIGNGDIGAIGWTPDDKLHFQVNKCDTWDDGPDESFGAWDDSSRANTYTALRHCCELEFESGYPFFDWRYLKDFQGRLSLEDATISWNSVTPFGKLDFRSFASIDHNVLVFEYNDELEEATTRKVKLQRFGTRVFEHWYSTIKRDDYLGPLGTEADFQDDLIWIVQPTRSLSFAVAAKIVGDDFELKSENSRSVYVEFKATRKCSFKIYLSVVTSEQAEDPLEEAKKKVSKAAELGTDQVYQKHADFWKNFWSKSYVELEDDYLTNLWYLQLYQLGSSSRGSYPPHFIGSLWSWTRDARPWNHYYHWNQQQYIWPILSTGHSELMEPYAKWRLEGLPHAIKDAKKTHNSKGAFYSDVSNRRGFQDVIAPKDYKPSIDDSWLKTYQVLVNYHISPGIQIAGQLYEHYLYTKDEEFLSKYTYPILRECVRFYTDYLIFEDGQYHVPKADPYETPHLRCKDTTNDLSYIRWLFPVFIELSEKYPEDKELSAKAGSIIAHLADFVYAELEENSEASKKLPVNTKLLAAGISLDTGRPAYSGGIGREGKVISGGHIGNAQMTPVFPTPLITLDDEETTEFEILKNTQHSRQEVLMGHNTETICAARLGLKDTILSELYEWVDHYQLFPQGFFSYFRRDYKKTCSEGKFGKPYSAADHLNPSYMNKVRVLGSEPSETIEIPTENFSHMGTEAGSVLMATINEMLLQSHGQAIRVFPCVPDNYTASFKLFARGGFIVHASMKSGKVEYIEIESSLNGQCKIVNPWDSKDIYLEQTGQDSWDSLSSKGKLNIITFDTSIGCKYIIRDIPKDITPEKDVIKSGNNNYKKLRRATLGKLKQF